MDKVELTKPDSSRTTEGLQLRFRLAWQRLALSRKARIFGGKPTKEYVNAALWLFFSEMEKAEAESFLAEWFPMLEQALWQERRDNEGDPDPPGGEGDPTGDVGGPRPPDAGFESREEPKRSARKRAR